METKQTAESTKTDAQFKIDYNSGKYYEAVSNKLFEISDTLSAMLGCSKDDILNPLLLAHDHVLDMRLEGAEVERDCLLS